MIHQFHLNGYNIVLDVNSSSVHVLDDISDDLMKYAGADGKALEQDLPEAAARELGVSYSLIALEDAWDELKGLKREGRLFSPESYGRYNLASDEAPIKSMCLNIAHDCNLRCKYCFASTGDFGGGRKLMPFEVGKAALDFLIDHSANRHNLEVDFFGGEPLMNFDVVRQVVAYGRKVEKERNKNIRFTITTNALLLDDDKTDFINREMYNVVLSIDGRKEVNDRMRVRVDGSGSYDEIIRKSLDLVKKRGDKDYYARATFTRENLDFAKDALHLADLGFDQVSVEPVITDEREPYALREDDLPRIFEEYETLAREIIRRRREGNGFNFFHFMMDLDNGPCLIKLLRGCGCGNEYIAVTPEGDIYPCHQFVGQKNMVMGNVLRDHDLDHAAKTAFSKANIFNKEGCADCWAKFFCSGGCNANNKSFSGSVMKPYRLSCEMEKKRVECALMIQAALA